MPKMALIALAILVAVLAAVVALFSTGALDTTGRDSRTAKGEAAHGKGTLLPDAVLSIAPGSGQPATQANVRKLKPVLQEFYESKAYAPLYERLSKSTTRTPEEQWMLAEILSRCAKMAENEPERFKPWSLGGPEARARFAASLAPNDPDRDKRLAAFDGVNYDNCAGLHDVESSRKDVRALLAAGAAGGDPKASAALVRHDIDDQYRGPDGKMRFGPDVNLRISDSQVDTLKQAMSSGDPYAIRTAMSTLVSGMYQNMSLRDADDRPLNSSAFYLAGALVSCDYGFNCGPDSQWVQNGCAFQG
ncbi:MAG TPA: hypothetical protein VGI57_16330, partial [Usitatibacter sp.]